MNAPRGRPTYKTVAVGAVDKVLVGANPKRRGIILCNCDLASTVYLAPNQPAVVGQGIALGPVYDDIELTEGDWGLLPGAEWHAVALLAGAAQGPPTPWSALAGQASAAAIATIDSFTVPAGQSGALTGASVSSFTGGAPQIVLTLARGATNLVLASATAPLQWNTPLSLQAGDTVSWFVNTPVAGSRVDVALSGYLQAPAGAAPSGAAVGVIELEG